mmetsp:Transcript_144237/g.461920  ORF Transcript_144237/g.461920 Transcript_144237/m.461920 type:complete len:325 (-) Transcript_144237:617-1591(-)
MQSVHIHGERKNCLGTNPRSSQHMSMCTGATDVRRQFCELRPNLTAETHKINTCKDGRSARFGPAPTHLEGLRLHGGARLRPAAHSMTAHWLLRMDIHSLTSSFDFVRRVFPDSALALRCAAASASRTSSCSAREHGSPLPKSFFSSAITLALEPVGVDSISSHPSRKRLNTSARSLASRFCALGALGAACAACSASSARASAAFNSASASAASSAAADSASKASSAPSSKAFAGSFMLFLCTAALVHGDRSRVGAPSSHGSSAPLPRDADLQQPVKHLHKRTMMSRSTSSPSAKQPAAIETPSPPRGSSTMASERSRCAICTT